MTENKLLRQLYDLFTEFNVLGVLYSKLSQPQIDPEHSYEEIFYDEHLKYHFYFLRNKLRHD